MKSIHTAKTLPQKQLPPNQRVGSQVAFPEPDLTAKQVRLLRQSFALIEPKAEIAGLVFFRQLFTLDPSLRELFQGSIELQGRKLMDALGYAVGTLDNHKSLVPVLESLGRRRLAYGVGDDHYENMVKALIQTL